MSASTERGILHTKIKQLNKVVDLKEKERKEWADTCMKKQSNIESLQEENRELKEALEGILYYESLIKTFASPDGDLLDKLNEAKKALNRII